MILWKYLFVIPLEAGAEVAARVLSKKLLIQKKILFWVWLPEEHRSECIMN